MKRILNIMNGAGKFKRLHRMNFDVFRHRGLGKAGRDIYELLLNNKDGLDIKEISVNCNPRIHPATIYRKLDDLERSGLVTVHKIGRGRKKRVLLKAITGADLDRAAEIIGTAGTLRRQIERHERERQAYREYKRRLTKH